MKKKYLYIILLICIIVLFVIGCFFLKKQNKLQNTENKNTIVTNTEIQEESDLNNIVIIKNGKIENENLIDDFINSDSHQNNKLEIIQDNDKIIVESIKPEISEKSSNDVMANITANAGDGSVESNKKIYGYYILTVNGKQNGEYDKWQFSIKRSVRNNEVTLYFDAPLVEFTEIPTICKYSLESSNYKKKFDLKYNQRKDLGIYEIYDTGNFKIKTFGGNVSVIIDSNTYDLKTALENKIINYNDIIEQAKNDAKYGICSLGSYRDGGSTEYYYYGDIDNHYTILKLNILDGDKDLVIGFEGPILDKYKNQQKWIMTD